MLLLRFLHLICEAFHWNGVTPPAAAARALPGRSLDQTTWLWCFKVSVFGRPRSAARGMDTEMRLQEDGLGCARCRWVWALAMSTLGLGFCDKSLPPSISRLVRSKVRQQPQPAKRVYLGHEAVISPTIWHCYEGILPYGSNEPKNWDHILHIPYSITIPMRYMDHKPFYGSFSL